MELLNIYLSHYISHPGEDLSDLVSVSKQCGQPTVTNNNSVCPSVYLHIVIAVVSQHLLEVYILKLMHPLHFK